jgi:rod shape-determining protein MreD
MIDRAQRPWVIAVSFVIAFMLTATPLPDWALPWRPAWIAMVLVYWCMALPARVGVLTGWCIGLVLDVLHGSILGQHAFGLALVAWIALLYHQRVRVYPLVQQALFVSSVVFLYLALMLWAYNLLGSVEYGADYLMGALTTGLLWPWVFVVLRDVRRRARVA